MAVLTCFSFVEFESASDLKTAVEKLDNREFKNSTVRCVADVQNSLNVTFASLTSARSKTSVLVAVRTGLELLLVAGMGRL